MLKDGIDIEEKKRRRTLCTSSLFDDDSGAGFRQRFPEFKWLLVFTKLSENPLELNAVSCGLIISESFYNSELGEIRSL